jgi:uncharacterized phage protein (TIGR01671 family)
MSRDIKFRAWSPSSKTMGDPFTLNDELLTDHFADNTDRWIGDTVFMQYTGLKDKNGADIYEGDIVMIPYSKLPHEIVFSEGYFGTLRNDKYGGTRPLIDNDHCEVIGNIYENPELLEAKS